MSSAPVERDRRGRPRWMTCRRGHAYTPENTYYRPDGRRVCLTCRRAQNRKDDQRRRHTPLVPENAAPLMEGTAMAAKPASTPLTVIAPDGLMDIYEAMVKLAWTDYEHPTQPKHKTSARRFLQAIGVVLPDGSVDDHGYHRHIRKGRKG
jgi:hypothetical protein